MMSRKRDIIVVGASLGGLEALCRLVSGLSADLPAALLIVLHTSPRSPRLLADIVGRYTSMSVSYAQLE
jgi:two-component system chemotaxis response regulator CheB